MLVVLKGVLNGHTLFVEDGREIPMIGYYAFKNEYMYGYFLVKLYDDCGMIVRKVITRIVCDGKETYKRVD